MDEHREFQQGAPEDSKAAPVSGTGGNLPDLLMRQGFEAMQKQEYRNSADIFSDTLRRFGAMISDSQKSMLHTQLATLFFWLGDYDSAEHHAENAAAFADSNDEALSLLGKIAVARFDFAKARGYFSRISSVSPKKELGLCLVALKLRERETAERYLREAKPKIPPSDPEYLVYGAYTWLLRGDTKTALSQAREALKKCERDPFLLLLLAEVFMTAANYGEAVAAAKKVQESCPENDHAYAVLAYAAHAEENYERAGAYAAEAVRLNPRNAYAKTVLMKLACKDGNYTTAERLGLEVLSDSPDYSLGHANLGDVYFNQGRYESAEIEYEQCRHLMNSDTKGSRLRQARIKYINNDFAAAAEILEKLVESFHTYFDDAMCDLALCYDELDLKEKKDEILQKMAYRKHFYHRTERLLQQLGRG